MVILGIAGLRTGEESLSNAEIAHPLESQRSLSPVGQMDNLTPMTPSNTPQSPISGRESPHGEDLQETVERISSLRLDSFDNGNVRLDLFNNYRRHSFNSLYRRRTEEE